MRELSGDNTFVVGLRVDEDGDLRFAISGSIIEIRFAADDQPRALHEVRIAEAEEAEFAPGRHRGDRNSDPSSGLSSTASRDLTRSGREARESLAQPVAALAVLASTQCITHEPEHGGPKTHEQSSALGVFSLILADGLCADPEHHAVQDGGQRERIEMPASHGQFGGVDVGHP